MVYVFFQMQDDKIQKSNKMASESEIKVTDLESQVTSYKEQANKTQTEVDRLLEILKEMENEKFAKDKQIKELQE